MILDFIYKHAKFLHALSLKIISVFQYNVNGSTIHSAFALGIMDASLQEILEDFVKYKKHEQFLKSEVSTIIIEYVLFEFGVY